MTDAVPVHRRVRTRRNRHRQTSRGTGPPCGRHRPRHPGEPPGSPCSAPGRTGQRADLTDPTQVTELLNDVQPASIIHLAAVILLLCYANPRLARKVNVDATANLVNAAAAQQNPPRFIQASSIAVYGPRNPHHITGVLTADTPVNSYDVYG